MEVARGLRYAELFGRARVGWCRFVGRPRDQCCDWQYRQPAP